MNSEPVFTASMLEAFSLCPMKYRLYRLGDPSSGQTRRVDAARALYAAVKQCLDECYRMGGPANHPVERLHEEFSAALDGSACADSREEEECRATGLRILTDYHADHLEDVTESVRVDVTLEGAIGDAQFRARADRREARPDGSVAYILYTTARRPPTPGPLAEDLRSGVLQLLAEESEGRPVEVEVHALRQRRTVDATKPPDALEAVEEHAISLATSARNLAEHAAVKGRHCRWCHARGVCPEWVRR